MRHGEESSQRNLKSSMAFSCPTESKGLLTVAQKMRLLKSNARTEDPLATFKWMRLEVAA